MLRYKTKTRLGLVALYDIRPGNGVGPFLQPRSQHGAAIFQENPGKLVPKSLHFIGAKDDGDGHDKWSYKICKAPIKTLPPINQHSTSYRPDALLVTQPTVLKHWREISAKVVIITLILIVCFL